MKKKEPVVHCVFTRTETELPTLLVESFRLYLRRILTLETESQLL